MSAQVEFSSSNIPIVVIETGGKEIVDEDRIVADMWIISNEDGRRNHLSDPYNEYSGKINIEIRGSSSQDFPKKSYGFETQYENGENRNVPLLDLPVEHDWVLYAPYSDKALIRNILSYRLSRELGQYAPRTKLCELVLNNEYQGVYVLIEKIKRDRNRVDISRLNPDEISGDDLSGGYIIKIDKSTGNSGPLWTSSRGGIHFQYEYPDYDEIVPEQKDYIKQYIDDFEQALVGDHFANPKIGYRKYMDVTSLVDFYLVNELTKNVDGYMLSTFFYKDKDSNGGKLNMGPIWDFNLALGNASYREGYTIDGFQVEINDSPWWWQRLLQDNTFLEEIQNKWCSVRENQYSDERITFLIDSLSVLLNEAQERNFERWDILGRKIWPNYYAGQSFKDEIAYLKNWTFRRLKWLDFSPHCTTGIHFQPKDIVSKVYPNPFVDYFNYDFALNKAGRVSLTLHDMKGAQVSLLADERYYPAGSHTINWQNSSIPGSIYVLVMKIDGEVVSVQKVVKL